MGLKLRYSTIAKWCIILMLIIHARYFYLLEIGLNRTILMSIFSFISFLFSYRYLNDDTNNLGLIWSFIGIWLIALLYSIVSYNFGFENILLEAVEYLSIFAAISVYLISVRENNVSWIENVIIVIGGIMATLLTVQGLVLLPRGISIFDIQFSVRLEGIRYVNSTEPIFFGSILAMAKLLHCKRTPFSLIKYGYVLIISTIELVFIAKTRALIIMYLMVL